MCQLENGGVSHLYAIACAKVAASPSTRIMERSTEEGKYCRMSLRVWAILVLDEKRTERGPDGRLNSIAQPSRKIRTNARAKTAAQFRSRILPLTPASSK